MSGSTIRIDNMGEALGEIREKYYKFLNDEDFADLIRLSYQGLRRILSEKNSPQKTRRTTLLGIVEGCKRGNAELEERYVNDFGIEIPKVELDFRIENHQIEFFEKERKFENVTNINEIFERFSNLSKEKQLILLELSRYLDNDTSKLILSLFRKLKKAENQNNEM